jgi:hypothetical protein
MLQPPEISVCTNRHVHFSLPWIMVSGLLPEMVLSVGTSSFHNMASSFALIVSTGFRACLYHCSLCNFTPICFHVVKCTSTNTLSCLFIHFHFANIWHNVKEWTISSTYFWHNLHVLSFYFSIFMLHFGFAVPDLLLLLINFMFNRSDLPSIKRAACLLH